MNSKTLASEKPLPHVRKAQFWQNFFKRAFDICFSLSLLFILSPFILGIMIAIRLCSKGGAFYIQLRIGKEGKVFKCYKFRTMHLNAEKRLRALLTQNPLMALEWAKNQKLKNDPRIFSLGKWLRRSSLDELPQFWNVVKGDLSVVGPRPYMLSQKKELGTSYDKILSIRPGITGLWQTSGRSDRTFQERIALDAAYVEKCSFFLDMLLICKTIPCVLFPKDAY